MPDESTPTPVPQAAARVVCPLCGERVPASARCAVCTFDLRAPVTLVEHEWRAVGGAREDFEAWVRGEVELAGLQPEEGPAPEAEREQVVEGVDEPVAEDVDEPVAEDVDEPVAGEFAATAAPSVGKRPVLIVENGRRVRLDGRTTRTVIVPPDGVLIGRGFGGERPSAGAPATVGLDELAERDPKIARRHARVFWDRALWWVEDIANNDATFLNDRRHPVNGKALPLRSGDRIWIGASVILRFVER